MTPSQPPPLTVSPAWDDAPDWMRESCIDGVANARCEASPEQNHANWIMHRLANGWAYGPVKDEQAKTHPLLVPYDELPPEHRVKDELFVGIVRALSSGK